MTKGFIFINTADLSCVLMATADAVPLISAVLTVSTWPKLCCVRSGARHSLRAGHQAMEHGAGSAGCPDHFATHRQRGFLGGGGPSYRAKENRTNDSGQTWKACKTRCQRSKPFHYVGHLQTVLGKPLDYQNVLWLQLALLLWGILVQSKDGTASSV